ncbi:MAG: PH domain-containing protein [Acidimicrobiales bacterium]
MDIKPHWMFLIGPLLTSAVVTGVAIGLDVAIPHTSGDRHWAEGVAVAVPCLWLAIRFMRWRRTSLVVTSQRIVERCGVGSRRTAEVWLSRIESIDVVQSVFRRVLGTGDLEISVIGEDRIYVFKDVRKPVILQRIIARRLSPPAGSQQL